jgi:hypothetical protein
MADGGHQVSLAQSHPAIDKKRVVLFARLVGDRLRRGMRKLIGRSHHELGETIAGVQGRMPVASRRGSRRRTICWHRLAVATSVCMPVAIRMTIAI